MNLLDVTSPLIFFILYTCMHMVHDVIEVQMTKVKGVGRRRRGRRRGRRRRGRRRGRRKRTDGGSKRSRKNEEEEEEEEDAAL